MKELTADPKTLRRYARCPYSAPVACLRENHLSFETGAEISEGGLLLSIQNDYKVGEIIELRFFIPGQASFSAVGEIAYIVEMLTEGPMPAKYAGLRFTEVSKPLQLSIRQFVSGFVERPLLPES